MLLCLLLPVQGHQFELLLLLASRAFLLGEVRFDRHLLAGLSGHREGQMVFNIDAASGTVISGSSQKTCGAVPVGAAGGVGRRGQL